MQEVFDYVVGKRIRVPIPDRDKHGNRIEGKKSSVVGVCTFCGIGYLWGLQVTVGRLPVAISSLKDIEIVQ